MELLIKQRVFSWGDSYDVYDETGEARYFVKAELFAFGHQIHVYDKRSGRELGSIHQKLFSFTPTFEIVIDGQVRGTVCREFTLFRPRYNVDYQVYQGDRNVMSITKEWLTWGDTYVLRYSNPADEMPGLLLVIAIDAANCNNN